MDHRNRFRGPAQPNYLQTLKIIREKGAQERKEDRNGDGLICYKVVQGSNVILMEMLPF